MTYLNSLLENNINNPMEENISEENISDVVENNNVDDKNVDEHTGITAIENVVEELIPPNIIPETDLNIQIISFNTWVNNNSPNLQSVAKVDLVNLTNANNTTLLKSIDCELEIIQLYKNTDDYYVYSAPCSYMKLFGENGFLIQYEPINNYVIKLYGTRTNVYSTICYNYNNILFPIKFSKFIRNNIEPLTETFAVNADDIEFRINDISNFDIEACYILHKTLVPVSKKNLTKPAMINYLINKNNKVFDVSHNIKIDNAIIYLLGY